MKTTEQAIKKLDAEHKKCKDLSKKGAAVSPAVLDALKTFCGQNEEFSQAVVQSDKSVKDCIEHTVKSCGSSISDLEVYRRAVKFYFPGADVHFVMTVDLGDGGFSNAQTTQETAREEQKPQGLQLSLDELLDF
ncbi:MAG: hypothetical protein J1F09_01920 [Oscillospiraceae bacterium]|nr:hypothetical protein [Oscillospiraceae bacterium]